MVSWSYFGQTVNGSFAYTVFITKTKLPTDMLEAYPDESFATGTKKVALSLYGKSDIVPGLYFISMNE